jgi:proteasome maturation protein
VSTGSGLQSNHPLENRLRSWVSTRDSLQQDMRRRNFGIAAAVRSAWDLQVVKQSMWTPLTLGGGCGVIEDVLTGRDCELSWDDVFTSKSFAPVNAKLC